MSRVFCAPLEQHHFKVDIAITYNNNLFLESQFNLMLIMFIITNWGFNGAAAAGVRWLIAEKNEWILGNAVFTRRLVNGESLS